MRTSVWPAAAVWALLAASFWVRGGFAFGFVFYAYSFICAYGLLIGWIGLRGLEVSRQVYPESRPFGGKGQYVFTAGEEAAVDIRLRRSLPLPLPWLFVRDRAGDWRYDRLCGLWLGTELKYRYFLPLPHRGIYRFHDMEVWIGDPFGIISRKVRVSMPAEEAVAAPQPYVFAPETEKALLLRKTEDRYAGDIREYRDGDRMTRVVWKTAARSDKWMVRTPAFEAGSRVIEVLVDSFISPNEEDGKQSLDLLAEIAAGVCSSLLRNRLRFEMWDGNASFRPDSWPTRLAALSAKEDPALAEASGNALKAGAETAVIITSRADAETVALSRTLRSRGTDVIYLFAAAQQRFEGRDNLVRERNALQWIEASGCRVVNLRGQGGVFDESNAVAYSS